MVRALCRTRRNCAFALGHVCQLRAIYRTLQVRPPAACREPMALQRRLPLRRTISLESRATAARVTRTFFTRCLLRARPAAARRESRVPAHERRQRLAVIGAAAASLSIRLRRDGADILANAAAAHSLHPLAAQAFDSAIATRCCDAGSSQSTISKACDTSVAFWWSPLHSTAALFKRHQQKAGIFCADGQRRSAALSRYYIMLNYQSAALRVYQATAVQGAGMIRSGCA